MAGIVLSIEVDDKGTVKVKQFADETKKAFDEMKKSPKAAQGPLDSLKESWVGVTAKIALATAAFYTAKRMIYDTAKEIASATMDIERQAGVLGISTDELQKWQYAAKMSDVNAQELALGLKLLSRNLEDASQGTGDASKYFSAMGVKVKDTSGNLRPLNDVMGDIMDKFASWEDGPRKIAIALALFGRSGETLIPLLNKGRAGFNEFAAEAQRLGVILSPELIKKGSEAEDTFKKIETQIQATKNKMAPYALELAKSIYSIVEALDELKKRADKGPFVFPFAPGTEIRGGGWVFKKGAIEEYKKALMAPYEPGPYSPAGITKPPNVPGKEGEKKAITGVGGTGWEDVASGMIPLSSDYDRIISQQKILLEQREDEKRRTEELRIELFKMQNLVKDFGWEDYAAGADASSKAVRDLSVMALKANESMGGPAAKEAAEGMERAATTGEVFAQRMGEAWNFNLKNIISESKGMGDAVKNVFLGIADASTSAISRMISDWLLFGSITGKPEKGKGVIGWLGGLLPFAEGGVISGWNPIGKIPSFATGTITRGPTLGIIGDNPGGEEAVIPLRGGKVPIEGGGKNNVNIVYIYAWDSQSLRDFVRRNPGPFIEIMTGDARAAGPMSKLNS